MDITTDSLFLSHPDPMWVYDVETFQFLSVNNAAIVKYGYSLEEFLEMTIKDIRPPEDCAALEENVKAVSEGRDEAGVWRHSLKTGEIIHVDIIGHTVLHHGRPAELISARDVTRHVHAEQRMREALAREQSARRASDALARQFQIMFDNIPGMFLVFSPENFDVIAVSDAYLAAMHIKRADAVGQNLFTILPPQPIGTRHSDLQASFARVMATGNPDFLEIQKFMLPDQNERLWVLTSTPVEGPDQRQLFLILQIQDVTTAIDGQDCGEKASDFEAAKLNLVTYTHELKSDNLRLEELATRLRTTQRLLSTGTWDYSIARDHIQWSDSVYDMYDTTPDKFGHDFEAYAALIHPEDRAELREKFAEFMASDIAHLSFVHRVLHPDGKIAHIAGESEKVEALEGIVLRGVVRDVTESVGAEAALSQATRMLEIAGNLAKFGAWRYDVKADLLEWSRETARIHDEADAFSPSVLGAISYFTPEYRDRIAERFRACLGQGEAYDEICEIIGAKGRHVWIRTTGEAERDDSGRIVAVQGSFQDVSELVHARKRAEKSEKLLEIAGQAVKLGGWRISLPDQCVFWTEGVAAILELSEDTTPTFEDFIGYFAPHDREMTRAAFDSCAHDGIAFDIVRDLVTVQGNRIKVRCLGEAVRDQSGKIIALQGAIQDISELTAAQRQVAELSSRLAETLENIGDAFFMLDEEWRFSYLNSRAEIFLNRSRQDLLGQCVFDEIPDLIGLNAKHQYEHAFDIGGTVRFEQLFPPLNRTLLVTAHPTHSGLAVYFTDITEERRRNEQLRLLDAAVAHINDIVIITGTGDPETGGQPKIVYVNDAFERITEFTREEAIGQTPQILHGPKTQAAELGRIQSALDTFSPVRTELINYTKSGREYWADIDIIPIPGENGVFTHFVAIERDVTERHLTEEALRLSEARFRMISQAKGNAVWEWNLSDGHQWWSHGMTELFGHQVLPDGALLDVWDAHVHPEDKARVTHSFDQLISGQCNEMRDRYRFRRADGSWATVEDRAFAIRNEDGRAVRILGNISDISERLAMEDRFRQSQKLEAVGQLTGGIAHDFNNLLTIIMGNTELLLEKLEDDSPLRQYADMSAMAVDRAVELTSRLLAFSRKQALQPKVSDVNVVIAGLEAMLRRTLGEDVDIRLIRSADLWQTEVDPAQLEGALLNLAVNARYAMPDGGSLLIETSNVCLDDGDPMPDSDLNPGEYVAISVSDNGCGIGKDDLDRVFEPFFTTKPVGQGTGLGLSMVYGFVKQTGGHVRIYSEPGEGTTIRMYFPIYSGSRVHTAPRVAPMPTDHGDETILIVEDDDLIRQQLSVQLSDMGYDVVVATAGAAAMTALQERPDIDLLLTDVVLPGGMNGRQVADAAQQVRPGLRTLYTSGYPENALVHHGRLDRGVELLNKPYRRSDLSSKVRKVLDA